MVRKRVDLEVTIEPKSSSVEQLIIESMICFNNIGGAINLKRLRYRGVPITIAAGKRKGEFKDVNLVLANRDEFIREIYRLKPSAPCCTQG